MAEPITDDDTLLRAARAGDAGALAHLQRRHLPGLWDLAVRCTLDEYAAKDVVREVFLRSAARVEQGDGSERFALLLFSLAVRQLAFREPVDPGLAADQPRYFGWPEPAPDGYDLEASTRAGIWLAVRMHGPDYKALDLYVRHGLQVADVGRVLGLDPGEGPALAARRRASAVDRAFLRRIHRRQCDRSTFTPRHAAADSIRPDLS